MSILKLIFFHIFLIFLLFFLILSHFYYINKHVLKERNFNALFLFLDLQLKAIHPTPKGVGFPPLIVKNLPILFIVGHAQGASPCTRPKPLHPATLEVGELRYFSAVSVQYNRLFTNLKQ